MNTIKQMNPKEPIRILQVFGAPDRGGSETLAMNLYRKMNRTEIQFDFTSHKTSKAAYEDEIESMGGRIFRLPKLKLTNYFQYRKAWSDLFKNHPEIRTVHIHNYNIAGIVAALASRHGIKTIVTHSHSTRLNMGRLKKIYFRLLHKSLLKNSTHLFACGHKAGKFLFGKNADFTIIPNAIDTARFRFDAEKRIRLRKSLGIADDVTVYGHVGSFRTPKNHKFLIDIYAALAARNKKSVLLLIGDGELRPEMERKVRELGLQDSVIFAGQKDNVNEWLSAFDLFIMPSLWEGFPVSVVEAQCSGLPCVISDVVDSDSDLTGHVKFLPLEAPAESWAGEILEITSTDRKAMGEIVAGTDFNIEVLTSKLSNFYKINDISELHC